MNPYSQLLNAILIAILIIDAFECAVKTFLHQVVYDTSTRRRVHLSPIQYTQHESEGKYSFLGSISTISLELQQQISEGAVHPVTHKPFDKSDLEELNTVSATPLSEKLFEMVQSKIAKDWPVKEYKS